MQRSHLRCDPSIALNLFGIPSNSFLDHYSGRLHYGLACESVLLLRFEVLIELCWYLWMNLSWLWFNTFWKLALIAQKTGRWQVLRLHYYRLNLLQIVKSKLVLSHKACHEVHNDVHNRLGRSTRHGYQPKRTFWNHFDSFLNEITISSLKIYSGRETIQRVQFDCWSALMISYRVKIGIEWTTWINWCRIIIIQVLSMSVC